ncbi:redoxin domain-containing protein [Jiangella endophytica]|uniref:redoxin domain-containing protein n=1 Tax=Jiangella endophytica TaxID=1623398 RepID=UPI000E34F27F|nr:redoxin domain-containing protein [Jiangella endophytica]
MKAAQTSAIALLAVLAGACGGDAGGAGTRAAPEEPTSSATTRTVTATTTPPVAVSPSPATPVPDQLDFVAPAVGGGTFDGASLAGQPAVVWFWAPWCPVCRREAPLIAELAGRYEGRVSFVGVAGLSGDLAAIEDFIDDGGVGAIPHIDDRAGEVYSRFGVTQQYDIGLVSADGTVDIVRGPLEEDEIEAVVERLAAR